MEHVSKKGVVRKIETTKTQEFVQSKETNESFRDALCRKKIDKGKGKAE